MKSVCQICNSSDWLDLPNPAEGTAVTTAGRIVTEPLGKAQCLECGFVQRVRARFLGDTDYYEQDYAKYYDRPGTTQYHIARYRVLAEWMIAALSPISPARILDVGCGQGWAMEAMQAFYPEATIEGLEPSTFNSAVARKKGFVVFEARAGNAALPDTKYDLVYSNNVIQHVTDARGFVNSLKDVVSESGVIVITCPDGSVPNIELLWSDQNFSFLPSHLIRLCRETGFASVSWLPSPPSPSVPPAQMLLLSKNRGTGRSEMAVPIPDLKEIYRAKCDYLNSFAKIDSYIYSRTQSCSSIYNFGASYWSSILAAYCPRYWPTVTACVVEVPDDNEQVFLDKQVLPLNMVTLSNNDAVVFGTSPATHNSLSTRYSNLESAVITWDQFLDY